MHIFFPVLGEADEWYNFLIHKILTECKNILELHFPVQMTHSVQTSMKHLIKYFHLTLIWKTQKF